MLMASASIISYHWKSSFSISLQTFSDYDYAKQWEREREEEVWRKGGAGYKKFNLSHQEQYFSNGLWFDRSDLKFKLFQQVS